jgi:hypothetical protein
MKKKLPARETYTPKEVRAKLNISVPNFSNWTTRGLIIPTYPAERQGSSAKFTYNDLIKIRLFMELMDLGMSSKLASRIAFENISRTIDKIIKTGVIPEKLCCSLGKYCLLEVNIEEIERDLK